MPAEPTQDMLKKLRSDDEDADDNSNQNGGNVADEEEDSRFYGDGLSEKQRTVYEWVDAAEQVIHLYSFFAHYFPLVGKSSNCLPNFNRRTNK
jgi:hypothetical protein